MTTTKHIFRLTILALFGLTDCNNSTQTKTEQLTTTIDSTTNLTVIQDKKQDKEIDTTKYDINSLVDDTNRIAKILTEGEFHSDEVWENADKEKWFGLFIDSGYYIAETKITTKRVIDGLYDENDSNKTGWKVQTEPYHQSIILIAGINTLSNHKIQQVVLTKNQIFPGDTLRFNYLGIDYKMFATAWKKKKQNDREWLAYRDYKLYLTANKNGQVITDLLVAASYFDDKMISIIFAGDIDGDGFLDLIIDTSPKYSMQSITLYLSKPADKGHLLKVVGDNSSFGC